MAPYRRRAHGARQPPASNRHGPSGFRPRRYQTHRQLALPAVVAFGLPRIENATAAFIGGEVHSGTEALGLCEPAEHSRPGAPRHCVPLSHLTHAYDVATRPWLLPMAANHSPLVAQLLPLLGAGPLPSARMSFSGALAWLDARGMT